MFFCGCNQTSPREELLPLPSEALSKIINIDHDDVFERVECFPSEWWIVFDDSQLTQFIQMALAKNPTVLSAQIQIASASFQADKVRSLQFPHLNLGADVARQKLSKTGVIPFKTNNGNGAPNVEAPAEPGAVSGIPVYFNLYETELNFTYNFDFWHKNKNLFRSSLSEIQANIAESAFVNLSVSIALAKVYFALQIDYQKLENLQAILRVRSDYLALVKKRLKSNLDNKIDLNHAEFNLADAKQMLAEVQGQIAIRESQLRTYLAGDFQEKIAPTQIAQQVLNHVPLPQDLPLHLIGRRPDIISQLWLIESAGRKIEVAKASFYPDFNLAGFVGYQTIHFRELFKWPSSYFNINPAMTLPVFEGGLLVANLRGSEVDYDLAILQYNELVLKATSEVIESLAAVRTFNQQLQQSHNKLQMKEEINQLMKKRVEYKLNNRLDQLMTEFNALSIHLEKLDKLEKLIEAILDLIKAIGGGYDVCYEG